MNLKKLLPSLCGIFIFIPMMTMALPSDQQKKLTISSKTANINRSTGVGIFKGQVVIDQGTTHVTGDTVTTRNGKDHRLQEVIIKGLKGKLAHYKTLTELKKPPLNASAEIIKYYPQRHYVILLKKAHIKQGDDSIQGEHLEYDIQRQRLTSTAALISQGHRSRTTIIIQPDGSTSSHPVTGAH